MFDFTAAAQSQYAEQLAGTKKRGGLQILYFALIDLPIDVHPFISNPRH